MSAKLAPHEQTAFAILAGILIENGQVERDALRVLVASKGGAIGREQMRFRDLGLVEEVTIRPNFLLRLFGAKPTLQVRLTEQGRKFSSEITGGTEPKTEPMVVQDLADPKAPKFIVEDAQTLPDVGEVKRQEKPLPVLQEIGPEAVSDTTPTTPAHVNDAETNNSPPRRFTPTDYTDVIGGQPEDASFTLARSERLNGLAELLGLMGFEMTPAGNLLAASRWSYGYNDAEVALDILLTSVAHTARLNTMGTARLDVDAILACLDTVEAALSNLVSEGHLTPTQLTEGMEAMRSFIEGDNGSLEAINGVLSDPLRGMAPPAMCPEEVWVVSEVEDE